MKYETTTISKFSKSDWAVRGSVAGFSLIAHEMSSRISKSNGIILHARSIPTLRVGLIGNDCFRRNESTKRGIVHAGVIVHQA